MELVYPRGELTTEGHELYTLVFIYYLSALSYYSMFVLRCPGSAPFKVFRVRLPVYTFTRVQYPFTLLHVTICVPMYRVLLARAHYCDPTTTVYYDRIL